MKQSIGIDMVDIRHISRAIRLSSTLAGRIFSDRELDQSRNFGDSRREQFLAGRFAVKEALLKALGKGIADGILFKEIECLQGKEGMPKLALHGGAARACRKRGIRHSSVSITHEGSFAVAVVIVNAA